MLSRSPIEIALSDMYLPPLLVAALLALLCTSITVRLFNRLNWHRFIVSPQLVELALTVIYTVLISTFVIPS